jgi:hypothetical protein
MSVQQSITDYCDSDNNYEAPNVARLKDQTPADLSIVVHLGAEVYHKCRSGGVPGCPNQHWQIETGTIEEAIEEELRPCGSCQPIDYRIGTDEENATEGQ